MEEDPSNISITSNITQPQGDFKCSFMSYEEYLDLCQFDDTKSAIDQVIVFAEEALSLQVNQTNAVLDDKLLQTEKTLNQFEQVNSSLNQERGTLEKMYEDERKKCLSLKNELNSLKTDHQIANEKINAKDRENFRLKEKSAELDNRIIELTSTLNSREMENSNMKDLVSKQQREYETLLQEKSRLEQRLLNATKGQGFNSDLVQKQILENENAALKEQNKVINNELLKRTQQYQLRFQEFTKNLEEIEIREKEAKRSLDLAKNKINNLESQLYTTQAESQNFASQYQKKQTEISTLDTSYGTQLSLEKMRIGKAENDYKMRIEELTKQNYDLMRTMNDLKHRLKPLEDELDNTKNALSSLRYENDRLKSRLQGNPVENTKEMYYSSLSKMDNINQLAKLEDELIRVKHERDVSKSKLNDISREVQESYPIIQRQKQDYEKLISVHSELTRKHQSLIRTYNDLEKSESNHAKDAEALRFERNSLKRENETLTKFTVQLGEDIQKLKNVRSSFPGMPEKIGIDRIVDESKRLLRERDELRKDRDEVESKTVAKMTNEFKAQYDMAMKKIEQVVREREEDKHRMLKLKGEKDTYVSMLKDLQKRFNISDIALNNLNKSVERTHESLMTDHGDLKLLLDEFKHEKQKAQEEYMKEYKEKISLQSQIARVKSEYDDYVTKSRNKDIQLEALTKEVNNLKASNSKLMETQYQLDSQVSLFKSRLENAKSEKSDLERSNDQKENMVKYLTETNKKLSEDVVKNQTQIAQLSDIIKKLNVIEESSRKDSMSAMTLSSQLDSQSHEIKRLMTELDQERRLHREALRQKELLELKDRDVESSKDLVNKLNSLENENKRLQQAMQEKETRLNGLIDAQLANVRENREVEAERLASDLDLAKALLAKEKEHVANLTELYDETRASLDAMTSEFENYQKMMEFKLDEKETEIGKYRNTNDLIIQMEIENSKLRDELDTREMDFVNSKSILESKLQETLENSNILQERIISLTATLNTQLESYKQAEFDYNEEVSRHARTLEASRSERQHSLEIASKLALAEKRVLDLQDQMSKMDSQANQAKSLLETQLKSSLNTIQNLETQNSLYASQLQVLSIQRERISGEFQEEDKFQQLANMLGQDKQNLLLRVASLEQEVDLLTQKLDFATTDLENTRLERDKFQNTSHLEKELETANHYKELYKESREKLSQDYATLDQILQETKKELEITKSSELDLKRLVNELKMNVSSLTQNNVDLQEKIKKLQERNAKLFEDFNKLGSEELKKLNDQVDSLVSEKEELNKKVNDLEYSNMYVVQERDKLKDQIRELNDVNMNMSKDMENMTSKKEAELETEEQATMETLREEWEAAKKTYMINIEKAKNTIKKWNDEAKSAKAQVGGVNEELHKVQTKMRDLETKLTQVEKQKSDLENEIQSIKSRPVESKQEEEEEENEEEEEEEEEKKETIPQEEEDDQEDTDEEPVEEDAATKKREREDEQAPPETPTKMKKVEEDESDDDEQDADQEEEEEEDTDQDEEEGNDEKRIDFEEKSSTNPPVEETSYPFEFGKTESKDPVGFGYGVEKSREVEVPTPVFELQNTPVPTPSNLFVFPSITEASALESEAPSSSDIPITTENVEKVVPVATEPQKKARRPIKRGNTIGEKKDE